MISLTMRMKLDLTHQKFSLAEWCALSEQQKRHLLEAPVDTEDGVTAFATMVSRYLRLADRPPARL
jgi:hypothetical protein